MVILSKKLKRQIVVHDNHHWKSDKISLQTIQIFRFLNYVFHKHLNLSYQQQVWIEVMLRQKMETIAIRWDVRFVTRSRISPLLMSCLQKGISIHKWIELSEIWNSINPPLEYIRRLKYVRKSEATVMNTYQCYPSDYFSSCHSIFFN